MWSWDGCKGTRDKEKKLEKKFQFSNNSNRQIEEEFYCVFDCMHVFYYD